MTFALIGSCSSGNGGGGTCGSGTCDINAACLSSGGGSQCVCNPGYVGNGTTCMAVADAGPQRVPQDAGPRSDAGPVSGPSLGAYGEPWQLVAFDGGLLVSTGAYLVGDNFYPDGGTESVALLTQDSAGQVAVLYQAVGTIVSICTDDINAYFIFSPPTVDSYLQPQSILSVPLGGGTPGTIAYVDYEDTNITTDGVNVYWSISGDMSDTIESSPITNRVRTGTSSSGVTRFLRVPMAQRGPGGSSPGASGER